MVDRDGSEEWWEAILLCKIFKINSYFCPIFSGKFLFFSYFLGARIPIFLFFWPFLLLDALDKSTYCALFFVRTILILMLEQVSWTACNFLFRISDVKQTFYSQFVSCVCGSKHCYVGFLEKNFWNLIKKKIGWEQHIYSVSKF